MCGINAVIGGRRNQIEIMKEASSRRGVRSKVGWVAGAYVHFNWLPITDPTAPEQPFETGDQYVFLNGFISNYKELAEKYGIELSTKCDTELLSKFLYKFGLEKLSELNGFFAVLWFNGVRWISFTDRYGIKKLYKYTNEAGTNFISSEVKSILSVAPEIKVNAKALNEFKSSLGVLNDHTIYQGIKRVDKILLPEVIKIEIDYPEAKSELLRLFKQSIERNRSELNDCVFLSGGIDSGIIAKYIRPRYCFSMDYQDPKFSEIENIKLNSEGIHVSLICNRDLFSEYSEKLSNCLQDPKVGSSYTNMALTELASKFCTIVYSGAGGDEFFGGYPHRKDRSLEEVINRTGIKPDHEYRVKDHFEYDLKFLSGVLNVEDSIGGFYTMETRYPLLDNDLVDFARSLPDEYLENKRILKDISGLDPEVLKGKKRGFSNPYMTNLEWVEFITSKIKQLYERRFI
jgi:asparagine synthase (glutamine-hydrolysing)